MPAVIGYASLVSVALVICAVGLQRPKPTAP